MEKMDSLQQLASRAGIEGEYWDYRGTHHLVSLETKTALLEAMGFEVEDGDAVARALGEHDARWWHRVLQPVTVVRVNRADGIKFALLADHAWFPVYWGVNTESGEFVNGEIHPHQLPVVEENHIGGRHYRRFRMELPDGIAPGYHRIRFWAAGQEEPFASSRLIVAPEKCYEPEALASGARVWGPAVQLYTLCSDTNWGMGDLGDLRELVSQAAELGADLVGLNPLHALYPDNPDYFSPYSPSSRTFLNVLYIDVTAVPEYGDCPEAEAMVGDAGFLGELERLRAADKVEYRGVARVKLGVLEKLFQHFCDKHLDQDSPRAREFEAFRQVQGEDLRTLAVFDALYEHFHRKLGATGWQEWPEPFQDPRSQAVVEFVEARDQRVQFYEYLQWQTATQLADAGAAAERCGMGLGVYLDLAVGVEPWGAETWAHRSLWCLRATIGAPPDPLALQGQDWGIPPMHPERLREAAYQPIVELLRNTMRCAGAIRIDHVMALHRLWWVPEGRPSSEGAYVYYDLEALLGIVALESQRNRCLVIGEDLGTVPDHVRWAIPEYGVYSYRVFYFEKEQDGSLRHPADYPQQALVTATTHDLPPLKSFWEESDLRLREELGIFPSDEVRDQAYADRKTDRALILEALRAEGLWEPGDPASPATGDDFSKALMEAIELHLASSRAAIMTIQLEDWLGMEDPVNVPGTSNEHANWQRKLTRGIHDILADPDIREHAARLHRVRHGE